MIYQSVEKKLRICKSSMIFSIKIEKIMGRLNIELILHLEETFHTISNLLQYSITILITKYAIQDRISFRIDINFIDNPSPSVIPIPRSRRRDPWSIEFLRWLNLNERKGGRCALLTSVKRRFNQSNFQIARSGKQTSARRQDLNGTISSPREETWKTLDSLEKFNTTRPIVL